jgi:ribosomal-protein-alanine N-acetyltransferase
VITRALRGSPDQEAIFAIDRASFATPTLSGPEELDRPWVHAWLAKSPDETGAGAPAAFLLAWLVADELHILGVATAPPYRRRGASRALMAAALEFAQRERVRLVLLEVRRSNHAAIHLYRALGFSAMAVRPHYYADNSEDAIEMQLVLDPLTGKVEPVSDEVRLEEA